MNKIIDDENNEEENIGISFTMHLLKFKVEDISFERKRLMVNELNVFIERAWHFDKGMRIICVLNSIG